MSKLRIAIDIEGVLRDTFEKIEQIYQKFFIDELELVDEDFKFEIYKPYNTSNYKNHFNFKNDEEYYNFMYNEFILKNFRFNHYTSLKNQLRKKKDNFLNIIFLFQHLKTRLINYKIIFLKWVNFI